MKVFVCVWVGSDRWQVCHRSWYLHKPLVETCPFLCMGTWTRWVDNPRFMNSSYSLHAMVSFCWPPAMGGSESENGLWYRACVKRGINRFFCTRIWPQIEEVIQWAHAENHSTEGDCWRVLSISWRNPLLTWRHFLKKALVQSSKMQAVYSVLSMLFEGGYGWVIQDMSSILCVVACCLHWYVRFLNLKQTQIREWQWSSSCIVNVLIL